MYDMITPMKLALPGDVVRIKRLVRANGYIVSASVTLYFVKLNIDDETVTVSMVQDAMGQINLSLRAIDSITRNDGTVVYQSDPRDMVYGQ